MKKFKIFNDLKKEEAFLNDMSNNGYIFKKCSFFNLYHFIKDKKQNLNYCIDYRTFNNKKDFEAYKSMFNDFGFKHIFGNAYNGKQYFLNTKNTNYNLFSSKESLSKYYKGILKIFIMNITALISYCVIIMELYWYNGSNFNISNMSFFAWIPIILFIILAFIYAIRSVAILRKYKKYK